MTNKELHNNIYTSCSLCPRNCLIDRTKSIGYCMEKDTFHVSRAALHMWEEPCISGKSGSGTVFFSGCNMRCVFCQNKAISNGAVGKYISSERLLEIFFMLKEKGANNINLVTGDIFIPSLVPVLEKAKSQNIGIPILLNTSSYLNIESVRMLDGLIDIYLPDMKYIRNTDAIRYSKAAGYVEAAKAAIAEMVRQQPNCSFTDFSGQKNIMQKGVVVRHLLMPDMLIQAKMIVKYLHSEYGDDIYISLMNQYTPNGNLQDYPEIDRKVSEREYNSLIDYAAGIGVTRGFMQVGDTASESFIPEFDCEGV